MTHVESSRPLRRLQALVLGFALGACGLGYDAAQDRGVQGGDNGVGQGGGTNPPATGDTPGSTTPTTGTDGTSAAFATGLNAVFTSAAVRATAASASVEAEIAAGYYDDTTITLTPMGKRFLVVLGRPIGADQLAQLQNVAVQPPLPVADRSTVAYARWAINNYAANSPNVAEFVGGASLYTSAAALFGLAWQNPNFSRSIVQQQDANTFVVRLYDPNGRPVSVVVDNALPTPTASPNTLAYVMAGSTDTPTRLPAANWASLVDKAIMKYCYVYGIGNAQKATYGAADFLGAETVAAMLTGNGSSVAYRAGSLSPAALQVVVARALTSGALVVGGWAQDGNDLGGWQVYASRAYTVGGTTGGAAGIALQYRYPESTTANVSGLTLYDGGGHRGVLNLEAADPVLSSISLRIVAPGAAAGGANNAVFDASATGGSATHL